MQTCQPTQSERIASRRELVLLAGMGMAADRVRTLPPPRCRNCGGVLIRGPFGWTEPACENCRTFWNLVNQ